RRPFVTLLVPVPVEHPVAAQIGAARSSGVAAAGGGIACVVGTRVSVVAICGLTADTGAAGTPLPDRAGVAVVAQHTVRLAHAVGDAGFVRPDIAARPLGSRDAARIGGEREPAAVRTAVGIPVV